MVRNVLCLWGGGIVDRGIKISDVKSKPVICYLYFFFYDSQGKEKMNFTIYFSRIEIPPVIETTIYILYYKDYEIEDNNMVIEEDIKSFFL